MILTAPGCIPALPQPVLPWPELKQPSGAFGLSSMKVGGGGGGGGGGDGWTEDRN